MGAGLNWGLNLVLLAAGSALAWLVGRWVALLFPQPWLATIAAATVFVLLPLVGVVAGFGRRWWLWRSFAGLLWIVPMLVWAQQDMQQLRQLLSNNNPWPQAPWSAPPKHTRASTVAELPKETKPEVAPPPSVDAGVPNPAQEAPADAGPRDQSLPELGITADAATAAAATLQAHQLTPSPWSDDVVEIYEDADGILTLRIVGTPDTPKAKQAFDYKELKTKANDDWPLPAVAHPVAKEALKRHGRSTHIEAAKFIRGRVADEAERARALHDFVALHLRYDVEAWKTRQLGPQDAKSVFKTRSAVCAGYARLLHAMAEQAGLRSQVVIGKARFWNRRPQAEGHAWNAIHADGSWWLFDATWDSGFVQGERFVPRFSSDFSFIPPKVMLQTHEPQEPHWRLLPANYPNPAPDRPFVHPRLTALGIALLKPQRAITMAIQPKTVVALSNPQRAQLVVFVQGQTTASAACVAAEHDRFVCPLPDFGRYEVSVMVAAAGESTLELGARFGARRTSR